MNVVMNVSPVVGQGVAASAQDAEPAIIIRLSGNLQAPQSRLWILFVLFLPRTADSERWNMHNVLRSQQDMGGRFGD